MQQIKKAVILSLLASTILRGMEKIDCSNESQVLLHLQALKRFPAYYYVMGVEPEIKDQVEGYCFSNYSKEELLDVLNIAAYNTFHYQKQKILNFCATLEVAAALLLNRPLEELVIADLQKMNALLMHNLHSEDDPASINEDLGKFKSSFCIVSRENITTEKVRYLLRTVGIPVKQELDLNTLTAKQLAGFDQYFVRTSSPKEVPDHMKEYLETLKSLAASSDNIFQVASYAHIRLSQIHPFVNANGRLTRILTNCLLMQKGYLPIIPSPDIYKELCSKGDTDQDYFTQGLRFLSNAIEEEMAQCSYDLEGSSLEKAQLYTDSIIKDFKAISLESADFVQAIGALKEKILKKIGLIREKTGFLIGKCATCRKTESNNLELFLCGRCKNPFYCSRECQKKDWPFHRATCYAKDG